VKTFHLLVGDKYTFSCEHVAGAENFVGSFETEDEARQMVKGTTDDDNEGINDWAHIMQTQADGSLKLIRLAENIWASEQVDWKDAD
jgi:hypothetical protein